MPQFDITENNLYSLTQESKKAIQNINDKVKVYTFGYSEESSLIDLLKQYRNVNNNIEYEILTTATNKAKIDEYELEDGYNIVIIEANGAHKLIDGKHGSYPTSQWHYPSRNHYNRSSTASRCCR